MGKKIDATKIRESLQESFRKRFGIGGEASCPNDMSEIVYGSLRPEDAPPTVYDSAGFARRSYATPRSTIGGRTYKNPDGSWMEDGYCTICDFTTRRPVTGEKLRGLKEAWENIRFH